MRNRQLHDALRAFALEAAHLLRSEQNAGAEVEFELEEGGFGGPTLYHYRPLSSKFIDERWPSLCALPTCEPAAAVLEGGAGAYLRRNGLHGGGSYPALQAMLERLYDEATDFHFPEPRFDAVYAEVEQTLYERRQQATVLVPVHGLVMRGERVELGDGLDLVRGDCTDAPDEAVWGDPSDPERANGSESPNSLLVLRRDIEPEDPLPIEEARGRFRTLLTGMRLFKPGGVALAAVAWRRTNDGRWQPFELEPTGAPRGASWILVEHEDSLLREFVDAIDPGRHGGPVGWALGRFEMGCGRHQETEALTDYLLALRALVDGGPDTGRSSLALRVAVLCATDGERKRVQRRLELAQALERFVIGDGAGDDYLDAVGADTPATLVDEAERHLRALLRDVLCGYLRPDLRSVADDLLLEQTEPFRVKARAAEPTPDAAASPAPSEPCPASSRPVRDATGRLKRSPPVVFESEPAECAQDETDIPEEESPREVTIPMRAEVDSVSSELDALERAATEVGVDQPQLELDDDPSSFSAPI